MSDNGSKPDYKKSIGALWLKDQRNGGKYFSGNITIDEVVHNIVIFKNDKGGVEKRPDYRIFPQIPRDEAPRKFEDDDLEKVPF